MNYKTLQRISATEERLLEVTRRLDELEKKASKPQTTRRRTRKTDDD